MIDYERLAPDADVELNIRYTNVTMKNSGEIARDVDAHASAESLSVWTRRPMPTGWAL
jgi:hypothetical protein